MQPSYLVTGAGSGIGRAIALALAADDKRVVLVGRTAAKLEATLSAMTDPARHHVLACDVLDQAGLAEGLAGASLDGGLAGVIANAGLGGANQYGADDRWDDVLAVNLTGTYRTVNEALPYLRKADGYRNIVFVSSILARLGVPGYSAYCTAKAGLLGLMRSMAVEYAAEKLLVNAICPGWVDTDMATEGIEGIAQAMGVDYEVARKGQLEMVPLRKMSVPDEIAQTVLFLVDGRQTSITGQALDVNNGALMPA